jgi:DNA-directed RNA polymerase subunit RPC12/RpoP
MIAQAISFELHINYYCYKCKSTITVSNADIPEEKKKKIKCIYCNKKIFIEPVRISFDFGEENSIILEDKENELVSLISTVGFSKSESRQLLNNSGISNKEIVEIPVEDLLKIVLASIEPTNE